jgi:hypothetical protein
MKTLAQKICKLRRTEDRSWSLPTKENFLTSQESIMAEILAKSILAEILANKLSQLATDSTTPAFASSVKYSASHLEANQQGKQNFRRICLQP